jgi:hypothetical protein
VLYERELDKMLIYYFVGDQAVAYLQEKVGHGRDVLGDEANGRGMV